MQCIFSSKNVIFNVILGHPLGVLVKMGLSCTYKSVKFVQLSKEVAVCLLNSNFNENINNEVSKIQQINTIKYRESHAYYYWCRLCTYQY